MPAGKKQNAITLTFSKKNRDLYTFLQDSKAADSEFVINEFICEAIRFYRENKDMVRPIDEALIKRIVDERLDARLSTMQLQAATIDERASDVELNVQERENLESDIDDTDIEGD